MYNSLFAISFSETINLGAVLIGVILIAGYGWASRKDKRAERWEELYNLADTERKEIAAQIKECQQLIAEQKETIAKLDALQMPIRIVELMNDGIARLDEHAHDRQEEIRVSMTKMLDVLSMIADKLGPEH